MWGGIQPQFYCTQCGIVTGHGGTVSKHRPVTWAALQQALDQTFTAINMQRIPMKPFMEALRYTLGVTPTLTVVELNNYGYDIHYGHIVRCKHD
jgi:hypothetical protein